MSSPVVAISDFRMSAFVALHGLRRYLRDHPEASVEDAARSLQRSDADFSAVDFEGAIRLHELLPKAIDFADATGSLRQGLSILIETHRPWWCRFFPYGRQRLATALTQDELQTFRSAGLFAENPADDVVAWWDRFASWIRSEDDQRFNSQGRYAEKLTLDHERKRLKSDGICEEPRWIALEDNGAGYDIRSFEKSEFGLKNLLIEVKSSKYSPPRMLLTRGEWDAAVQYGDAYIFHLWELPSEKLRVLTVGEIAQHVPTDQGVGRWTELEIQF